MIAHLVRNINSKRPRCRGVSVTLWRANGHHILDNILYHQLTRWARYRHPRKSGKWCYHRTNVDTQLSKFVVILASVARQIHRRPLLPIPRLAPVSGERVA